MKDINGKKIKAGSELIVAGTSPCWNGAILRKATVLEVIEHDTGYKELKVKYHESGRVMTICGTLSDQRFMVV